MEPKTKADLFAVLAQRTGLEVINERETPTQLRFTGRLEQSRWPQFALVIKVLLVPKGAWTCDISKQYVIVHDEVRWGWRFIFQAEAIEAQYASIAAAIQGAPRPNRTEVTSMLLPGYKPGQLRGGVNARGKGVASAGSAPMAVTRRGS